MVSLDSDLQPAATSQLSLNYVLAPTLRSFIFFVWTTAKQKDLFVMFGAFRRPLDYAAREIRPCSYKGVMLQREEGGHGP